MKQVDQYGELNVNAYGVLKPPLLLWIILLIETWHWWSSVFIVFSGQNWLFEKGFGWINFAFEAPALLVLAAISARMPSAPKLVSAVWRRGRELITLTAVGNIAMILVGAMQTNFWLIDNEWPSVMASFLHAWVMLRLWVTSIIRQVFSEFPT